MATITVTTEADSGAGSLREAFANAASGDIITFAPGVTSITLTSGELLSTQASLTIDGDLDDDGRPDVTISAGGTSRVFNLQGLEKTLDGLIIKDGATTSDGGAIYVDSQPLTLTVKNSVLTGCSAGDSGGALYYSGSGAVTIVDTTISNNTANTGGAAWANGSILTIESTTINGNVALLEGSALRLSVDVLTVANTTITGNGLVSGSDPGVVNAFSTSSTTIANSTIVQNGGFGLYLNSNNPVLVRNSIVAQNSDGDLVTISGVDVRNSLVGNGLGITNGVDGNLGGTVLAPLDPALGSLADNGGLVQTMAPLTGSPVIDAGANVYLPADALDLDEDGNTTEKLPLDARGEDRLQGGVVDMGAFEVSYNIAPTINVQGTIDLAAIGSTTFEAWEGAGDGTFTPFPSVLPLASPTAVALGDVNGDGILDALVTIGGPSGPVYALLGDGLGQFLPTIATVPIGGSLSAIATGDLNGDGKLDAVVTTGDSPVAFSLLNSGAGFFNHTIGTVVGHSPQAVQLADVNGDGKLDALIANSGSNTLSVLIGNGAGAFTPASSVPTGTAPVTVAVGDINGDGYLDALVGNSTNVSVLLGDGTGAFTAAAPFTPGAPVISVALGDFNHDNVLDLAALTSAELFVALGNGAGQFAISEVTSGMPAAFLEISLADVNVDGKLDILASLANGAVYSLLGVGNGHFGLTGPTIVPGLLSFAVGDLNSARATAEDTAVIFDAAHSNAITLEDTDSAGLDETLTLSVEHGTLTLATLVGLDVTGDGTATVTLTGSIAELNAAIDGLKYLPTVDYEGKDKLTISLNDNGNVGVGGAKTATSVVPIVVAAVADPTVTTPSGLTTSEDTSLAINGFSVADTDSTTLTVTLTAASTLTLSQLTGLSFTTGDGTADTTMTFSGTTASINAALAGMLYAPTANFNGAGGFAYSVDDGSDLVPTSGSVAVIVTAVNDAPSLSLTPVMTSLKEMADTSNARKVADLVVSDIDGGANALSLTGADAGLFTIQGNELFLKAGAALDFESNPKLDVTVVLDDGDGAGPDDSEAFSLDITDVVEVLTGTKTANVLVGTSVSELINGKGGNDTIRAGGGDDTVRGGAGADVVTGGAGADVFVFKPGDLPKPSLLTQLLGGLNGRYDLIRDFTPGEDVIDLSALDANSLKSGNQKFRFEGEGDFSGKPRALVYELYGSKPSARHTIIKGDTNGDGDFDFRIVLKGHHDLDAGDFVL